MPDGNSLLVGGHDGTQTSLWLQPLDGAPKKLNLGDVSPTWSFWIDALSVAKVTSPSPAFRPTQPSELYYMASANDAPRRLTNFNKDIAALHLGEDRTLRMAGSRQFQGRRRPRLPARLRQDPKNIPWSSTSTAARRPLPQFSSFPHPTSRQPRLRRLLSQLSRQRQHLQCVPARHLQRRRRRARPRRHGRHRRLEAARLHRRDQNRRHRLVLRRLHDVLAHRPLRHLESRPRRRAGHRPNRPNTTFPTATLPSVTRLGVRPGSATT